MAALAVCATSSPVHPPIQPRGESWPEADLLFHANRSWLGSDDAYSISLGGERILWMFGDSFVCKDVTVECFRNTSGMIRNTISIQTGVNPETAIMQFFWREGTVAFFPPHGSESGLGYWPGDAALLNDSTLVVFLMRVLPSPGGFGFKIDGTQPVLVHGISSIDPMDWVLEWPERTVTPFDVVIGSPQIWLGEEKYLLALADYGTSSHASLLCRYSTAAILKGDFSSPMWWNGERFLPQSEFSPTKIPATLLQNSQSELTLTPIVLQADSQSKFWLEIQTSGFGPANVTFRIAPSWQGPWSPMPFAFFPPPENAIPRVMIYAGKAHPELWCPDFGCNLVVTYASNSFDFEKLVADDRLYYPKFVKVRL